MKTLFILTMLMSSVAMAQVTVTPLQVQCAEQPAVNSNEALLVYGQMAYNIDGTTKIDLARFQGWTRKSIKESSSPYKFCQKIKRAMSSGQNLKLRVSAQGEIQELN
jgi:hypothetical protein